MVRLDSIDKHTPKEKASRKDSSANSGKRSKKEKAPRKKPVERSFLDEDVNR